MPRRANGQTSLTYHTVTDWLSFAIALLFAMFSLGLLVWVLQISYLAVECQNDSEALAVCGTLANPLTGIIALLPSIALALALLIWRRPVIGIWVLFLGATLIEGNYGRFPDATTELIPFWRNLSSLGIVPLPFSPAEVLLIACTLAWLVRNHLAHTLRIHSSIVLRMYGCYLLIVFAALVLGAATGGNITVALWEVRAPTVAAVVLLLTLNILRSRQQIEVLGWLLIIGSGLKGVQGVWRYVVTLGRTTSYNSLLEHEEALFFPAFYLYLLLLFIFGGSRRQQRIGLSFLPFVLLADFANQRRASTAVLVVALVALTSILLAIRGAHRRRVLQGLLVAMVVLPLYVGAYWNSGSRLAQPIRAIRSQFVPNSRDESSDLYRELENRALMWQIRANPLGRGYGIELPLLAGMWDARNIAPFILYMPHNSVLWIWWRTGIIGFAFFWMTIGIAIMRNCMLARSSHDPFVRRWAIFAVLVTLMWAILGYLDQGLLLYREVVYVWILLAVPEVLRRIAPSSHVDARTLGRST